MTSCGIERRKGEALGLRKGRKAKENRGRVKKRWLSLSRWIKLVGKWSFVYLSFCFFV